MQGTQYATKRSILCRGAFCGPTEHIGTDPSTSSYFVTLSLEYPKGPCLIEILAQW